MNTVVFWQNMPSHILAGPMRRFAERWKGEVHAVFDVPQLREREELGWEIPDLGMIGTHYLAEKDSPRSFVRKFMETNADAIHVLGGFRGCLAVNLCRAALAGHPNLRLASIAERPLTTAWWKTPLLHHWYRGLFRREGRHFGAVLAMGTLGVDVYASLGCPREILVPFLYHVSNSLCPEPPANQNESQRRSIRFVYVGQFIKRKGVDVLLKSIESWPDQGWELTFVGRRGPYQTEIARLADRHPAVRYAGMISSGRVVEELARHDVCLIPSRHDGWGVVANESLLAGIGAIVSREAASFDLIEASGAGEVIPGGSSQSLAEAVCRTVAAPERIERWKTLARDYAPLIGEESLGDYLHDVLYQAFVDRSVPRPIAQWLKQTKPDSLPSRFAA